MEKETLESLKVKAYDFIAMKEFAINQLAIINQEIARRGQKEVEKIETNEPKEE